MATIRKFLQDHITVDVLMVRHTSFLGYPTHYLFNNICSHQSVAPCYNLLMSLQSNVVTY